MKHQQKFLGDEIFKDLPSILFQNMSWILGEVRGSSLAPLILICFRIDNNEKRVHFV
jgi:hypothetical protein